MPAAQISVLVKTGNAMRARLRVIPLTIGDAALWGDIRKGRAPVSRAFMGVSTNPGQITLTPIPSARS